jgi:hypothetical protein
MSEANTPADILLQKAASLTSEALELMQLKNHDYTSGSGDPYANFRTAESFGVHPAVGIVIRVGDKLQRIRTFAERGHLEVDGEGLRDACLDVINYAVLVYGLLTEGEGSSKYGVGRGFLTLDQAIAALGPEAPVSLREAGDRVLAKLEARQGLDR